jgi:hypothetical protein
MQREYLATAISLHYLSAPVIITDIQAGSDLLWLARAMQFELSHDRRNIADEEILSDVRRVAASLCSLVLRQRDYSEHGKVAVKTAIKRLARGQPPSNAPGLKNQLIVEFARVNFLRTCSDCG